MSVCCAVAFAHKNITGVPHPVEGQVLEDQLPHQCTAASLAAHRRGRLRADRQRLLLNGGEDAGSQLGPDLLQDTL
jgi:hypothetical protein